MLLLLASVALAMPRDRLVPELDALHDDPFLGRAVLGTKIQAVESGEALYARNADVLLLPASTVKLVTAAAALEHLGPDHVYETVLATDGRMDEAGVLRGDLVVVGSGDPTLAEVDPRATLRTWAAALRDQGITRISGDVVADDRVFAWRPLGDGWAWDDALWRYGAPVAGLMIHHDVVRLTVTPGASEGEEATVEVGPLPACLPLDAAPITLDPDDEPTLTIDRPAMSEVTVLRGGLPAGSAPRRLTVTIPDPPRCLARTLREVLEEEGIGVDGEARRVDRDAEARPMRGLHVHPSAPLRALLTTMLVESDNLYAEAIARSLDPAATGRTYDGARPRIEAVLLAAGVPSDAWALTDGSGLSRMDLMTAEALVRLLRWAWRRPWREEWLAMLPVSAEGGTMRGRMVGGPAAGQVQAKTGSMTNIFNIAGYTRTADGTPVAFAMLSNAVVQPRQAARLTQDVALELVTSTDLTEEPQRRRRGGRRW